MVSRQFTGNMYRGCALGLLLVLCPPVLASQATEEEEAAEQPTELWRLNVGVRSWYNEWTNYGAGIGGFINQLFPNADEVSTNPDRKLTFIPLVSLQLANFQFSTSYLASATYQIDNSLTAKRKEFDVNVGYRVMPGLVFSLAYKSFREVLDGQLVVVEDGGSTTLTFDDRKARYTGPTLGISGTVPFRGNLGGYMNFGFGPFSGKLDGGEDFKARYLLVEPGLSYTILTREFAGLDAVVLTLGYRYQQFKRTREDFNAVFPSLPETTKGMSFGVMASF